MDSIRLQQIQGELARNGLDGWLLYDFHGYNDVAVSFLDLSGIITRRSFYFIPTSGRPTAFIHAIEKKPFDHLPGEKIYYSSYKDLEENLGRVLTGKERLAMEYSPHGRLPYIGKVDAGTIELVRSFGVEIVSSADLVARFDACLTPEQIVLHSEAAVLVNEFKDEAFALIAECLSSGKKITEYDVVTFLMGRFRDSNMTTDFPPVCGVRENGGNPHYVPTDSQCAEIVKGDLILIDLWAKLNKPKAVYGDITWMAYAGNKIPGQYAREFALLTTARDAAFDYLMDNWGDKEIFGYQVDDVCRSIIEADNLGSHFIHRTGHSIAESVHGSGPNIDNLETEDRRMLMPGHLFSIEPGLYFDDHGLRSEINVLITDTGPEVTTRPVQNEIVRLPV